MGRSRQENPYRQGGAQRVQVVGRRMMGVSAAMHMHAGYGAAVKYDTFEHGYTTLQEKEFEGYDLEENESDV